MTVTSTKAYLKGFETWKKETIKKRVKFIFPLNNFQCVVIIKSTTDALSFLLSLYRLLR